ncbi:MAG: MerR family transcriptional regulator [Thermodesulfobacteriota bacterium]
MENTAQLFRIGELERLSGVARRNIHFYMQQGLLHPPRRTGRTMAYYDASHINKLAYIMEQKALGRPLFSIRENIDRLEAESPGCFSARRSTPARKAAAIQGRRVPRQGKSMKTREAILDLGSALFRQKGYRATRVSDITTRLNIGKGTFYFYFSDKKELLLACVPRIFSELFANGWDTIRQEADPLKRLELRARAVLPVLDEFCAILAICEEAHEDPDPKLKQMGEQTLVTIRQPMESDIRKGMAQGLIRKVDPAIAAALMIGAMRSMQVLRSMDSGISDEAILREVIGVVLSGIRQ